MPPVPAPSHATPVGRRTVDPAREQIAAVYAKALVGAAERAGQTPKVLKELESFVADVLDSLPALELVLASKRISSDEKGALVDRTLGGRASMLAVNFLKVMGRHGRLDCLREAVRTARQLYDELHGRRRVEVASAAPLDGAVRLRLADTLRRLLGGEPELVPSLRPELIGGLVLRVGDTIYDGSVATRLARLRTQMIERSVDEIQRRRDRFRYPAGN